MKIIIHVELSSSNNYLIFSWKIYEVSTDIAFSTIVRLEYWWMNSIKKKTLSRHFKRQLMFESTALSENSIFHMRIRIATECVSETTIVDWFILCERHRVKKTTLYVMNSSMWMVKDKDTKKTSAESIEERWPIQFETRFSLVNCACVIARFLFLLIFNEIQNWIIGYILTRLKDI